VTTSILSWYLIVQLITLITLPLALRLFANLPDRGYVFAKTLGILLVSFTLWLGTSYGILRNETGGAWLALFIIGCISFFVGRNVLPFRKGNGWPVRWSYMLTVEVIFLGAFIAWAWVRAHDPAADHTEQPMDLMFMNSIWNSATFPPQDAWLGGYAISYYYYGYWILTTLGRLSGQPPEIAYNVGQACWYGLLLSGAFGVVYNMVAYGEDKKTTKPIAMAFVGGLIGMIAVGVSGNLQVILEWLYANGYNIEGLTNWFGIYNFPQNASVTNLWHIDNGWWWWRSSRVLEDFTLTGNHIEVIDEFPFFSYLLGDNHPHVLAMPFVILVIALAQNFCFAPLTNEPFTPQESDEEQSAIAQYWSQFLAMIPLGWGGLLILLIAAGGLIFFNTWDFPPYWLLLMLVCFGAALQRMANKALPSVILLGGLIGVGALVIYLPYFLTAQSQAGGFLPNLFNPTRFPQFIVMFGPAMLAVVACILLSWSQSPPALSRIITSGVIVYGVPIIFLAGSAYLMLNVAGGHEYLMSVMLPMGETEHLPFILERWRAQGLTFLVVGLLLTLVCALIWQRWSDMATEPAVASSADGKNTLFALLMISVGLALVYAPEFIYLRDNFGTRMNTVFKFYYQAWLLLSLGSAYTISTIFRGSRKTVYNLADKSRQANPVFTALATVCAIFALLLILGGMLYPFAGVYAKTNGFSLAQPTLDATGYRRQRGQLSSQL